MHVKRERKVRERKRKEKETISRKEKVRRFAGLRRFWRKYLLPVLCLILMLGVLFGVLVLIVSSSMKAVTRPYILTAEAATEVSQEAPFDCILVLGAGLRDDRSPSDMLYDRVQVGTEMFTALGDTPLLMSGDHTGDYNEVAVMKSLATELGADSHDIFLDHKGYSTYESICRAKEIFGARRVLIITQEYHLHRAIHIAQALGMEAYGVSADLRPYQGQMKHNLREALARYKDLILSARGDTQAYTDDLPVNLDGDGDLT